MAPDNWRGTGFDLGLGLIMAKAKKKKKKKSTRGRRSIVKVRGPLIVRAIELGMSYRNAALAAGVSERALYNWLKRGEKAKSGEFMHFMQDIKKALAKAELLLLELINDAAMGNGTVKEIKETVKINGDGTTSTERTSKITEIRPKWQAGAWILERRHPEKYGRKVQVAVTWETEVLAMVTSGDITIDEAIHEFGEPARELIESSGIHIIEARASKA